jgi:hypothetical protein
LVPAILFQIDKEMAPTVMNGAWIGGKRLRLLALTLAAYGGILFGWYYFGHNDLRIGGILCTIGGGPV